MQLSGLVSSRIAVNRPLAVTQGVDGEISVRDDMLIQ